MPKLQSIEPKYREFFKLLMEKAKMHGDMDPEWHMLQANYSYVTKIKCSQMLRHLR